MGAYYKFIWKGQTTFGSKGALNPHDFGYGYKLMEHAYTNSLYLSFVLGFLLVETSFHPIRAGWLCDYNEKLKWNSYPNFFPKKEWEKAHFFDLLLTFHRTPVVVVNRTKKQYFSYGKVFTEASRYDFLDDNIDPLPLLLNSEKEPAGGGDYYYHYPMRGEWFMDEIQAFPYHAFDFPSDYEDISLLLPVPKEKEGCDEKNLKRLKDLEKEVLL